MSELYGLTLIYLIPGILAAVFWLWPIRRLINLWTGRDVMLTLIPKREHVHHTERVLGIRTRKTTDRTYKIRNLRDIIRIWGPKTK